MAKFRFKFKRCDFFMAGSMEVRTKIPDNPKKGVFLSSVEDAKIFFESLPREERIKYIKKTIVFTLPRKIDDMIPLLITLHELGHFHNKDYLCRSDEGEYQGILKREVKAWAYALRGIKKEYHDRAFVFLIPKVRSYVSSYVPFDKIQDYTPKFMRDWIEMEMEIIDNYYRRISCQQKKS